MFGPLPPPSPTVPLWASGGSPGTRVSPEVKELIYSPRLVPLCPLMRSQALSPQLLPRSVVPSAAVGDVASLAPFWTSGSPGSLRRNFFFLAPCAVGSLVFAAMVTVFSYLHIFTRSVERRILIVVPVDTLYRTSIISSSTVLLLNPFANLSLAPLSLFSIYGPDLRVWPDCWSPRSSSAPSSLGRGRVVPPPPPCNHWFPRASSGQNSEAAHPANRKRRLLGTRHGQLSVLSCLTFGSCRIGLLLATPSWNHACWDFFLLVFLVPQDFVKWLE